MKKNEILKLAGVLALSAVMLSGCAGSKEKGQTELDANNPLSLKVWHYYNGTQQATFDSLLEEFNATVGKEKGIYVEGSSYGAVADLEKAVESSLNEEIGADDLPDMFSSYADTAYSVQKEGKLADLTQYFTDKELSEYVDSYIQEGYFGDGKALYLLPVAKSTEIMMLNRTDWDKFANAAGVSLEDLSTLEGVAKVAEKYYKWTDAKTPKIPDDGKAFYGRDSLANYFVIGMRQMGQEIFQVKDGKVTFQTDKKLLRRLWENYYVPYVNGYFTACGRFRSDDVKTGDILAYTGSTSSTFYFPDQVENGGKSHDIDFEVLDAPIMEGGENYKVQQGAGMAVTKSDPQREYASCVFLKWFTKQEQNLRFVCDSGYMPVRKKANNIKVIDEVIQKDNIEMNEKAYASLKNVMSGFENKKFYTTKNFQNSYSARTVLDTHLAEQAKKDRKAVEEKLAAGVSRKQAVKAYISDASFEKWYRDFCDALAQTQQSSNETE